jgi:serine/threonine protein kinase
LDRAVLETASDRYIIVEYLAEGGMGAIYLGKKLGVDGFEKEVVLKQLLPEYTREPKFIDLFLREARLSASLDHANIVRTVDLVNAGDDYFMVMEYVRGGDLRTLLRRARRRHRRFSLQASVFIGHEILEALAYAHAKAGPDGRPLDLIHRDVSPSNILLSGAGEVKLTDFGIAKASTHRSVFHKVKGKVGYMSPEQARGEAVDRRADLFSLGVVLYEVLVGERLFVGDLLSTAAMVYSQKVRAPSHKREDVPTDLDQVILKALALDPRDRFQNAEEMQEALARVATRARLLSNASEMATHLRWVCGDDPSSWLKLETLARADESQQLMSQGHGTAVLSTVEDGVDPFDDSEPHPARPQPAAALQHKELTSVIALRGDEVELISESQAGPLPQSRGESARERLLSEEGFESETSHARTRVRPEAQAPLPLDRPPSVTGEKTLVREDVVPPSEWITRPPARSEEPTRTSPPTPEAIAASLPTAPPRKRRATATATLRHAERSGAGQAAGRQDSGWRAAYGPRRLFPLILLLLFIGVSVAAVVAFSGSDPEEVVLPEEAAPAAPSREAPSTPPAGAGSRETDAPR